MLNKLNYYYARCNHKESKQMNVVSISHETTLRSLFLKKKKKAVTLQFYKILIYPVLFVQANWKSEQLEFFDVWLKTLHAPTCSLRLQNQTALLYIQLHPLLYFAIKMIKNPDNSKLKRPVSMENEKIGEKRG